MPFAEWREVFPNAACVVSLVDRLVRNAEVLAIEGESFRADFSWCDWIYPQNRRLGQHPVVHPSGFAVTNLIGLITGLFFLLAAAIGILCAISAKEKRRLPRPRH